MKKSFMVLFWLFKDIFKIKELLNLGLKSRKYDFLMIKGHIKFKNVNFKVKW